MALVGGEGDAVPHRQRDRLGPRGVLGGSLGHPVLRGDRRVTEAEPHDLLGSRARIHRGQLGPGARVVSARAKLVEVALKESEFFDRSIVNRMWHRFFGYGLVLVGGAQPVRRRSPLSGGTTSSGEVVEVLGLDPVVLTSDQLCD